MPIYQVNIDRRVTTWERFTRYVEAATPEAAEQMADELAVIAELNCPEDAHDSGHDPEFDSWGMWDCEEVALEDVLEPSAILRREDV